MAKQIKNRKVFRKKSKSLKVIFRLSLIIIGAGFLFGLIVFAWFFKDLPRPEKFAEGIFAQSTKIYDRTGEVLLYEIAGEEKRTIVPLEFIPDYIEQAFLTAEDRKFYQHQGVDLKGIARAIIYDLRLGNRGQGASTISQQLIRSYYLTQNKTIKRKTREIILSLEMERRYSKDQILEWYLNLIPFGSNLYGIEAASQTFFDKSVSEISLAQAAVLAALVRAPSFYSPYGEQVNGLLEIKDRIIQNMVDEGYINQEESDIALGEEIVFSDIAHSIKAPHFVLFVKSYLEQKYGQSFLSRAGLRVITTLDADLQNYAQDLIKSTIDNIGGYNARNGSLVAINPKNGQLLAMVGSKDFFGEPFPKGCSPGVDCQFDPQVNVALRSRQPGSSFKPIVYATAFNQGFIPETLVWDVQTEFNPDCLPDASQEQDQFDDDCYHPQNYSGIFKGLISLRESLAQSRNLPAVKVLYLAGLPNVLSLAKLFGITTLTDPSRYGLSLVLGAGKVKLIEMVSAFAVFAQDGIRTPMNFIIEIKDLDGKTIEAPKPSPDKVVSSQVAQQINSVLSDNEARTPVFGPNSLLNLPGYEVAVKTGTTQRYNDAWTIGYTPNLAVGVWVGNNDNTSMTQPGVVLAGPIWHNVMVYALSKLPIEKFNPPKVIEIDKPMLGGVAPSQNNSILYFVDKKNPQGPAPENSSKDPQYNHWEYAIKKFLGVDLSTTTDDSL